MNEQRTAKSAEAAQREINYNNTVLIGNWYEERYYNQKTGKRSIVPGAPRDSGCVQALSIYRDSYQFPTQKQELMANDYLDWKQLGMKNRIHSLETTMGLFHGKQFQQNFTTTTDIMYRMQPLDACHEGSNANPLKPRPPTDLLRSYGNATVTGMREWKQHRYPPLRYDKSHYQETFVPKLPMMYEAGYM